MEGCSNAEVLDACFWEVHKRLDCDDSDCDCLDDFKCWEVVTLHPLGVGECTKEQQICINRARQCLKQRKLCRICGTKLMPVGDSRRNGKSHRDWPDRAYHKKCWLSVLQGAGHIVGGGDEIN